MKLFITLTDIEQQLIHQLSSFFPIDEVDKVLINAKLGGGDFTM